jgi:hypothetical protein
MILVKLSVTEKTKQKKNKNKQTKHKHVDSRPYEFIVIINFKIYFIFIF